MSNHIYTIDKINKVLEYSRRNGIVAASKRYKVPYTTVHVWKKKADGIAGIPGERLRGRYAWLTTAINQAKNIGSFLRAAEKRKIVMRKSQYDIKFIQCLKTAGLIKFPSNNNVTNEQYERIIRALDES